MQKFDIDILKRNINSLLKNKGVTQQQLADALGMSQSNVSKALSEREKKCFTVEQIIMAPGNQTSSDKGMVNVV